MTQIYVHIQAVEAVSAHLPSLPSLRELSLSGLHCDFLAPLFSPATDCSALLPANNNTAFSDAPQNLVSAALMGAAAPAAAAPSFSLPAAATSPPAPLSHAFLPHLAALDINSSDLHEFPDALFDLTR
jgi:hypothetical protein